MRINLTKKDLINLVYMQIGFSKQVAENFDIYAKNLKLSKALLIGGVSF